MRHNVLADILSIIKTSERVGKKEVTAPASKIAKAILLLIQKHKYIGNFEFVEDKKGGKFIIQLLGQINNCNVIRPEFAVKADEYEKWERRFLPASGFGLLIVSTSNGIMTHAEAKKKGVGGRLLAYIY